ncbi:protein-glutamate methylesterase/protein-glutamine glutaminase [Nitrincola nitratireducens]|uniref:Protein-glutamate methylesterase/protein-glutamine glutaminase n=1 Tax=Nitrincola nitratireducens TaxID=1229521 RepID=W9UX93_9GAMM|nr:chemotaxis response regulator protein-glutamate methylesterase [Nitrincola nitratireducens]EXJ09316.1 Chemotaxis response regulator protein-glutamate methylesterase of group 1 operon [Nitrincola nitratireducens]
MAVKVLIVDDSSFFRNRIEETLGSDPRIKIVGTAVNGTEAVEKATRLRPDLITMDVEMPKMNGIEAVRQIMQVAPTNVLMLSSLTHEGARVTLRALEAGAVDYLPKDIRAWMDRSSDLRKELIDRVVALGTSRNFNTNAAFGRSPSASGSSTTMVFRPEPSVPSVGSTRDVEVKSALEARRQHVSRVHSGQDQTVSGLSARQQDSLSKVSTSSLAKPTKLPDCRLVVIGASTGGPAALQAILTRIPSNFPHPILLIQHMPSTFTKVFAERLNQQCAIEVREAVDGDRMRPGLALLCPGGMQLMIDPRQTDKLKIIPGDERLTYKPSVDFTYASAARLYQSKVLGIILTGMGADGCEGARRLKEAGSVMWAQSKETCTIYGMPQAVVNAGLADAVLDLNDIGDLLSAPNGKK